MKLHLGCFDQAQPGWVNTDITPHIWVARVPCAAKVLHRLGRMGDDRYRQHAAGVWRQVHWLDVSKRFPFPDGCMEAVYSSHLLEHVPQSVAENCLRESFRVLRPGGVVRVGVPDLDIHVQQYDREDPDTFVHQVFQARAVRDKNRHWWMYNECSLARALRAAGFPDPIRRGFREGVCPDLDALDNRPEVTLFMEALKQSEAQRVRC
jgi:SAM-dependent methyltransferase